MKTFQMQLSGVQRAGKLFYFIGDADGFRVVPQSRVLAPDGAPVIDPPFGAVLLMPGSPGAVWLEFQPAGRDCLFRHVEGWWNISPRPTRQDAEAILKEELATLDDPDCQWGDGPGLIGAIEVSSRPAD